MAIIKIKRGSGVPSGLTFGEPAFDITNNRFYVGITGGSALLGVAGGGVHSFNGLTGTVTGVTTGTANTFGPLQSFTSGISAFGGTFSSNIAVNGGSITTTSTTANVFNTTATTLNIGDAATTTTIAGVASGLTLNIANTTHFSGQKIINIATNVSGGGTQTITIGQGGGRILSTTSGLTFGSVSGSAVINIVGTACNIAPVTTFNGLLTASAGISASGGITFNSTIISNGYRYSSSAIETKTAGFTLTSSDNGKIFAMTNSANASVNIPTGLPIGFACEFLVIDSRTTFVPNASVTLNMYDTQVFSINRVQLISYATDTFLGTYGYSNY